MDKPGDYSEDLKELITSTTTTLSNCATTSPFDGDSVIFRYKDDSSFPKVSHLRSFRKNGLMDGANRHDVIRGRYVQRSEKDVSATWAIVHELGAHGLHSFSEAAADMAFTTKNALALRDAHSNESKTAPFKSVQAAHAIEKPQVNEAAAISAPAAAARAGNASSAMFSCTNNVSTNTSSSRNAKTATATATAITEPGEQLDDDENESAASFDFNRHRSGANVGVGPLTKPTPSKWDDAEKWLSAGESAPTKAKSKISPLSAPSRKLAHTHPTPEDHDVTTASDNEAGENSNDASPAKPTRFVTSKKNLLPRFAFMPSTTKSVPLPRPTTVPVDRYPLEDVRNHSNSVPQSRDALEMAMISKAASRTDKPTAGLPIEMEVSGDDGGKSDEATVYGDLPNMRTSVCMRDMGTEMTPLASVDASRTATPVMATTPTLGSPAGSRPSSPPAARVRTICTTPEAALECGKGGKGSQGEVTVLSGKEKTRAEILALGTQLGKANVAAWATKEEEEADAVQALKATLEREEVRKNLLASRAAAWEEAEHAKYTARFKREEAKIQAWENHEKAKAEAEMRRVEMKVERMRSHANEKLMNKLAAARQRAGDLRAKAEAVRCEHAAKSASRSEHIRRTGKIPTSLFSHLCG